MLWGIFENIDGAAMSKAAGVPVEVTELCSSTSREVADALREGRVTDGYTLCALEQTAGHGRLGREFSSRRGGLYMSTLLVGDYASDATHCVVSAALAVAHAISELTGIEVGIKWVNDILIDGRKVCGILAEGVTDPDSGRLLGTVVGIGLNVKNTLPPTLQSSATSLREHALHLPTLTKIGSAILTKFRKLTADPTDIDSYRALSVMKGKAVHVTTPTEEYDGVAVDIAPDCSLTVRDAEGVLHSLRSGEATLHQE